MQASTDQAKEVVLGLGKALNDENLEIARRYVRDDMKYVGPFCCRDGAEAYLREIERLRLKMLGGQLERELAERKVWQTTVAARVKWILLRLLGGQSADLGEVAKDLGMSNRTLQRRITSEGTSFRQLVCEARYELAKHYLLDPSLELTETAYLLGYEDPNSFFRAFREWEGTTPNEWRAAQRGRSVQNEESRLARPIRQLST